MKLYKREYNFVSIEMNKFKDKKSIGILVMGPRSLLFLRFHSIKGGLLSSNCPP